ncbi:hypothetical protein GGTG_09100 [Gaeumannomyces tritici R3-111a-1]|uniref:FAD-binding domain-containing protein n=1 Tax=Gaeumannomyces tritici (strain R3-111a-1) TaxID=644352 RepID=J3P6G0_GAET3|nr:hypothetical protein GGTG_09100 [Gaeumannomyces tritici R3-111a-1]EJT72234.1 hypothetical protein GGTG_09100 [Gaeumannomyces tritici R3-111a-1]
MTSPPTAPRTADPPAPTSPPPPCPPPLTSAAAEFSRPPTKPFDVGIVGGGIAGVALALQLLRHGVAATVYEQGACFAEVGAGISLGPNAARALELISPALLAAAAGRAARPRRGADDDDVWFDLRLGCCPYERGGGGGGGAAAGTGGEAGERGGDAESGAAAAAAADPPPPVILRLRCKGGQVSMLRAHLLDELAALLPVGAARMGHHVVDCQPQPGGAGGVVLRFAHGAEARHDAVVACDGIRSLVRRCVLGPDDPASSPVFSGKYAYRGLVPLDALHDALGGEEELDPGPQMYLGRGGHVIAYPLWEAGVMNIVAFSNTPSWPDQSWVVSRTRDEMLADFAGWHPRVRLFLSLMGPSTSAWALFDHGVPAASFCDGRVCLAGDAAHASTPHMGAGAGVALEDACVLGALLGDPAVRHAADVEVAFRVFDAHRRARGLRVVADSRVQGRLYGLELDGDVDADPARVVESLRGRMRWLWDHDLDRELDEARADLRGLLLGRRDGLSAGNQGQGDLGVHVSPTGRL